MSSTLVGTKFAYRDYDNFRGLEESVAKIIYWPKAILMIRFYLQGNLWD